MKKTKRVTAAKKFADLEDDLASLEVTLRSFQDAHDERGRIIDDLQKKVLNLNESTGGLWKTRDGVLVQVRDMTDSHLRNAREWLKDHGKSPSLNLDAEFGRRLAGEKLGKSLTEASEDREYWKARAVDAEKRAEAHRVSAASLEKKRDEWKATAESESGIRRALEVHLNKAHEKLRQVRTAVEK